MTDTAFEATRHPLSTPPGPAAPDAGVGHASERHVRFVYEIARRAGIPTWLDATAATRNTLQALGEWLDADLRAEIAEHLPDDLGGALTDADVTLRRGDVVALYRRAATDAGEGLTLHDVALRCAAVLAVLGESLPAHLVDRLTAQLPEDISALVALADRRG